MGSGLELLFTMSGLRNRGSRRTFWTLCAGIGLAAALAAAADVTFSKVRAGVVADLADSRGVACMESVERTRYAPRRPNANATCAQLIAATADTPRGVVEWRSRLRLDVTAGPAADEFALTQASSFERTDVGGSPSPWRRTPAAANSALSCARSWLRSPVRLRPADWSRPRRGSDCWPSDSANRFPTLAPFRITDLCSPFRTRET